MNGVETMHTEPPTAAPSVEEQLALAFAPLHKRAFGTAIGVAAAAVMIVITLVQVIVEPAEAPPIGLLSYYFYGYDVTWWGALVGAFWAFIAGFVAGWFVAFCRNFVVAVSVFLTRARADLQQTRDFLDHI